MPWSLSPKPDSFFARVEVPNNHMGVSENKGYLFWGPYNKNPTIYGTILRSPIFGNSHIITLQNPNLHNYYPKPEYLNFWALWTLGEP